MLVGELIKKLSGFDENLTVYVSQDTSSEARKEAFDAQLIEGDVVIVSDEE